MKRKNHTSPLQWIVISFAAGLLTAVMLCLIGAALVLAEVLPQHYDFLCSAVGIAAAVIVTMRMLMAKNSMPKWMAAASTAGVFFALLLLGNLTLREPNLGLLGLNAAVLAGSGLLSILTSSKKRKAYRVRY